MTIDTKSLDVSRLPSWLRETLPPEVQAPPVISFENGSFFNSGIAGEKFETLDEASTAATHDYALDASILRSDSVKAEDAVFDDSGNLMSVFQSITGDSDYSLLFLSSGDPEHIANLVKDYDSWVSYNEAIFDEVGTDFIASWEWLNRHPMFWVHSDKMPLIWSVDGNFDSSLNISIYRADEELLKREAIFYITDKRILLEVGGHIEPEFQNFYIDTDLISVEETFEKAVLKVASKVKEFYSVDGSKISDPVSG